MSKGAIAKGPTEKRKVNSILNINDPMPRNECQKADKNKRTPMKASYIRADAELQVLNCRKIPSIRELKLEVHHSHKRTLWDRGS